MIRSAKARRAWRGMRSPSCALCSAYIYASAVAPAAWDGAELLAGLTAHIVRAPHTCWGLCAADARCVCGVCGGRGRGRGRRGALHLADLAHTPQRPRHARSDRWLCEVRSKRCYMCGAGDPRRHRWSPRPADGRATSRRCTPSHRHTCVPPPAAAGPASVRCTRLPPPAAAPASLRCTRLPPPPAAIPASYRCTHLPSLHHVLVGHDHPHPGWRYDPYWVRTNIRPAVRTHQQPRRTTHAARPAFPAALPGPSLM
jgi:hypothetical protein